MLRPEQDQKSELILTRNKLLPEPCVQCAVVDVPSGAEPGATQCCGLLARNQTLSGSSVLKKSAAVSGCARAGPDGARGRRRFDQQPEGCSA